MTQFVVYIIINCLDLIVTDESQKLTSFFSFLLYKPYNFVSHTFSIHHVRTISIKIMYIKTSYLAGVTMKFII